MIVQAKHSACGGGRLLQGTRTEFFRMISLTPPLLHQVIEVHLDIARFMVDKRYIWTSPNTIRSMGNIIRKTELIEYSVFQPDFG
jgi:hypothetical protein